MSSCAPHAAPPRRAPPAQVFLHTDAAQAVGKIPVNVDDMKIDLMSISGHKVYGPKGVGAIYLRRRPRVRWGVAAGWAAHGGALQRAGLRMVGRCSGLGCAWWQHTCASGGEQWLLLVPGGHVLLQERHCTCLCRLLPLPPPDAQH
jgi:hypothetical protein